MPENLERELDIARMYLEVPPCAKRLQGNLNGGMGIAHSVMRCQTIRGCHKVLRDCRNCDKMPAGAGRAAEPVKRWQKLVGTWQKKLELSRSAAM